MCYINTLIVKTQTLVTLDDLAVTLPPTDIVWSSAFSYPQWPLLVLTDGALRIQNSEWGFLPSGLKTEEDVVQFRKQFMTQNATCENMQTSRTYSDAVINQRCIIPSSGFIEWQHLPIAGKKTTEKIPYYVQPANSPLFYMAGLYNCFLMGGNMLHTFTMVTTGANTLMATIHNTKKRMPTMFSANEAKLWLTTPSTQTIEELAHTQLPEAEIKTHIIAKNFKDLDYPLQPYVDTKPIQLDLFG
jgi:putative SOS response-associated peptidase YedK